MNLSVRSNWWILYGDLSYNVFLFEFLQWLCGHVHVVINIGDFNIGEFSEKSPIANINSSPINRLVRYLANSLSVDKPQLFNFILPIKIKTQPQNFITKHEIANNSPNWVPGSSYVDGYRILGNFRIAKFLQKKICKKYFCE